MTHNKWTHEDEKLALASISREDRTRVHILHRMRIHDQLMILQEREEALLAKESSKDETPHMSHPVKQSDGGSSAVNSEIVNRF